MQLPASAPTLADVCHDPLLLTLGLSHLKPLMAASRQLRAAVHSFIRSLTIGETCAYDLFLLVRGNWGSLETLVLKQPLQLGAVLSLAHGHLPKLSSLEAQVQGQSTLPFFHLGNGKWPLLRKLNLSNSHLTAAAMAEVTRGRWPGLKQLVLHSCRLDPRAIAHLTEAKWTSLEVIDLHANPMGAQDMEILAAGSWPSLTTLNAGTLLEEVAWGNLICGQWPKLHTLACAAEWPPSAAALGWCPSCGAPDSFRYCLCSLGFPHLRHLCLYQPDLTVTMAAWVSAAWQAQLHTLRLTGCIIDAQAFAPISTSDDGLWPLLQELDLECVNVNPEVIRQLTDATMPMLKTLRLDRSRELNVQTFADLSTGDWPLLQHLYLNDTLMDLSESLEDAPHVHSEPLDCISHLVQAFWPKLERLEMSNCSIDDEALCVLILGEWPELCYLDLSSNPLDEDSYATLQGQSRQQIRQGVNILQPTRLLAGGFWPKLSCIDLSARATQ